VRLNRTGDETRRITILYPDKLAYLIEGLS